MRTPTFFGRNMKKLKEYEHFIMFIDEKTNVRECFSYWDLTHWRIKGEYFVLDFNSEVRKIETTKKEIKKQDIKNDNRLMEILKMMGGN